MTYPPVVFSISMEESTLQEGVLVNGMVVGRGLGVMVAVGVAVGGLMGVMLKFNT
ncbi:MAG: hypothetical protein FD147_759 [Chloroflexi bacterium]|nr:MAG: hypothetical protein FD147_759 [Chloroflexota bacterium]